MADNRVDGLIKQGDYLFEKKIPVNAMHQDIAENFYPERADFTSLRTFGTGLAENLTTSYPIIARRDLGNTIQSMLRPKGQEWFHVGTAREDREDNEAKRWLQWGSANMRRAMYDPLAQFEKATGQGDHDWSAFGQTVISVELNHKRNTYLYRCWHLRDCAWCEGSDGIIDTLHIKWKPAASTLRKLFGDKIHQKIKDAIDKDKTPYREFEVRRIVMPADEYEAPLGKKWKTPFVSIYVDVENSHVIEEVGLYSLGHAVPRWSTVSGSQYAYSPATVAALPDARLIQAMTLILLEAGEKAVDPPVLATEEVIRSDVQMFAGGITWADRAYDERTGEALRILPHDNSGLGFGMEMRESTQKMIAEAFYLNKISLPDMSGDRTATEISQRVNEYVRNAMPLFAPMEPEYNGAVCELTFDLGMRAGLFGSYKDIPQSIRGSDIQFRFQSPLHDAIEKQKGQIFMEMKGLLAEAIALDPSSAAMPKVQEALRDTLNGIGVPAKWLNSEKDMEERAKQIQKQQQADALLASMDKGADVAQKVGDAGQSIQQLTGVVQ